MGLNKAPHRLLIGGELAEEEASVVDVDVVAPGGELHREELVRCKRTYQQRGFVDEDITERKPVDVALGRVVQPVIGQIERPGNTLDGCADEQAIHVAQDQDVDVLGRLTSPVQKHHSCASDHRDLAPG